MADTVPSNDPAPTRVSNPSSVVSEKSVLHAISASSTLTQITNIIALNPNLNPPIPPPAPPSSESAANMDVLIDRVTYESLSPKARPLAWLKFRETDSVTGDGDWGVEMDREEGLTDDECISKCVGNVRHGEWKEGGSGSGSRIGEGGVEDKVVKEEEEEEEGEGKGDAVECGEE